jgi:Protein of unknown function (DUF2380)
MRHSFLRPLALCLSLAPPCGQAATSAEQTKGAVIAVIDFGYSDTSGEPRDQRKEHEAQLAAFMNGLRSDLGRAGSFQVVEPTCRPEPCSCARHRGAKYRPQPLVPRPKDWAAVCWMAR